MPRRVFFSFHYDDVGSFRANVVRNCASLAPNQAEFYDASLWEESRQKGKRALERLILNGLKRTSVTAVLIGEETAYREWVRYEIVQSFVRGNGLLGVHLHTIKDKNRRYGARGVNPFSKLAYRINSSANRLEIFERVHGRWLPYKPMPSCDLGRINRKLRPRIWIFGPTPFSDFVDTYTWRSTTSPQEFPHWVEQAAIEAGR